MTWQPRLNPKPVPVHAQPQDLDASPALSSLQFQSSRTHPEPETLEGSNEQKHQVSVKTSQEDSSTVLTRDSTETTRRVTTLRSTSRRGVAPSNLHVNRAHQACNREPTSPTTDRGPAHARKLGQDSALSERAHLSSLTCLHRDEPWNPILTTSHGGQPQ